MRLTKFNPETNQYEYIKKAKTQAEFNEQRKAVIQKLGEYEDKASEVAEEIFGEIETSLMIESFHGSDVYYAIRAEDFHHYKKKYTESEKDNE